MKHKAPSAVTLAQDADATQVSRRPPDDITERTRAEDALRREHDRAQGYLDTVWTMIVALDEQGRITTIDRKGCQLLVTILGRPCSWRSSARDVVIPTLEDTPLNDPFSGSLGFAREAQ